MSRLAEILGGRDGQSFTVGEHTTLYRVRNGRLQWFDRCERYWRVEDSCIFLELLISGKKEIHWQQGYTAEQRRECTVIRLLFPDAETICVGNYWESRNCVCCDVFNSGEGWVAKYLSAAFSGHKPGDSYSISEILMCELED